MNVVVGSILRRGADAIMFRRARRLRSRLGNCLPDAGTIVDIGSGTGHNAAMIASDSSVHVEQFDVADIHWVDPPPKIFAAGRLPLADDHADCALVLHVLQYCDNPTHLLVEAGRIAQSHVVVMQTTAQGMGGRWLLPLEEFCFGRLGYYGARWAGLISASQCPLVPRRFMRGIELRRWIDSSELQIVQHTLCSPRWYPLQCEIYVLAASSGVDIDRCGAMMGAAR